MKLKQLDNNFYVSGQIRVDDIPQLVAAGVKSVICNRPDGEAADQPDSSEIAAAVEAAGLFFALMPVSSGNIQDSDHQTFQSIIDALPAPALAYCRSGTRSTTLWAHHQIRSGRSSAATLATARSAGFDLQNVFDQGSAAPRRPHAPDFDIVIVGAGAGGIAVASSILKRCRDCRIAVVDPSQTHYYQPGWTMVGAGIFDPRDTVKTTASLIPPGVDWIQSAVAAFEPELNQVVLENNRRLSYTKLVVAPGLKLDWHGVEGLVDCIGRYGVTSNYRFDLAPYTWQLVSQLKSGKALFTQPAMPIKCAGAPQKALYLSANHWERCGHLANIDIEFCNAGGVLFGVEYYVPALMKYVERYHAKLSFHHTLKRIDGPSQTAWFEVTRPGEDTRVEERQFDFIHVCPPQCAPDFVRESPLADANGWIDVDQNTLQHKTFDNVWALGDVINAPNAKTAAAARAQAPVVAQNLLQSLGKTREIRHYNGYGSCPLTVEKGKIVLAEFGYGGKLLPSFPKWLINGARPSRLAWLLKERILPPVYWQAMLKGREWMISKEGTKVTDAKP